MFRVVKLITLGIFVFSLISCGKDSSKSNSKKSKSNQKLLTIWERTDEQGYTHEIDLTKSIFGNSSPVKYDLTKDNNIITCSGTILLKGTDSSGTIDEIFLNLDVYPIGVVTEDEAKGVCKNAVKYHNLNIYTLKNYELKLCEVGEKNCLVFK